MSFDLLPADLLLKIFHQLSFKDRVRLSGVNRSFRDISMESIAKMKTLHLTDDLLTYSIMIQPFSSLLESCSLTLESIFVNDCSCNKYLLTAMADLVYPKLKHIEFTLCHFDNVQLKTLISRCPNLRSTVLYVSREFEWAEDIILEKLEKLVVEIISFNRDQNPTRRPLIDVPNFKCLLEGVNVSFSGQEFSQLLASTPNLKDLTFDLSWGTFVDIPNFKAAISTWRLPKLTNLYVNLNIPTPSSILHHFPASFPRLESCILRMIKEIDDQAVMALSQLKYLKELRLPDLEMTKEMFSKMITAIQSINVLEIKKSTIDGAVLQALSQLQHLRELCIFYTDMTKSELIALITNVPLLAILKLWAISDVGSPQKLIDFLTSTVALFQRNLEIRPNFMYIKFKSEQKAILDEVENNGGPMVDLDTQKWQIRSIRYSR